MLLKQASHPDALVVPGSLVLGLITPSHHVKDARSFLLGWTDRLEIQRCAHVRFGRVQVGDAALLKQASHPGALGVPGWIFRVGVAGWNSFEDGRVS